VTAGVGENPRPFPTEFERQIPEKPRLPVLPLPQAVLDMTQGTIRSAPPVQTKQPPVLRGRAKEDTATKAAPPEKPAPAVVNIAPVPTEGASDEPEYRQGEQEKIAFDLLLEQSSSVKSVVSGSNPALRFKGWGAAKREDDVYWVRLTLTTAQGTDADYIWQIRVTTRLVTPLNFNARSLPR
jgi:hypothetical protein